MGKNTLGFLYLKQTMTLSDQSISVCKNGVVWIQRYLSQKMQQQHFFDFQPLLRGLHGRTFDRQPLRLCISLTFQHVKTH